MSDLTGEQEALLETAWGPAPSPEEVEEARIWNDEERVWRLTAVLTGTINIDHLAHKLGISWDEAGRRVQDKEVLAMILGSTLEFIPMWQFDETEDGTFTPNPRVMHLWKLWGKEDQAVGFCEVITLFEYHGWGATPLELIGHDEVDAGLWQELEFTMQTRGINYM